MENNNVKKTDLNNKANKPEMEKVVEVLDIPTNTISELDKIRGVYKITPSRETWLTHLPGNSNKRNLHEGVFIMYSPELHFQSGAVVTGLTKVQQIEFEQAMNKPAGSMSPFNFEFWSTYHIKIPDTGRILNCDENIADKLIYQVMKSQSCVVLSKEDLEFNIHADFLLTSDAVEKVAESKIVNLKKKAYAKLSSMTIKEMEDFLKVYEEGKFKVGRNAKPEFVEANIGKVVDEKPDAFLNTFDTPYYQEAVFLQSCVDIKAITKQGQKYFINGGEKLGDSYVQVLMNLASGDFDEAKVSLLNKLNIK